MKTVGFPLKALAFCYRFVLKDSSLIAYHNFLQITTFFEHSLLKRLRKFLFLCFDKQNVPIKHLLQAQSKLNHIDCLTPNIWIV